MLAIGRADRSILDPEAPGRRGSWDGPSNGRTQAVSNGIIHNVLFFLYFQDRILLVRALI